MTNSRQRPHELFLKGMHTGDLISTWPAPYRRGASTILPWCPHHTARSTRSGPHTTRPPAQAPHLGIGNSFRMEFCLGPVTRGSHVPWQPRGQNMPVPQTCSVPEPILLSQAEFRVPRELNDKFALPAPRSTNHGSRSTVVEARKHWPPVANTRWIQRFCGRSRAL